MEPYTFNKEYSLRSREWAYILAINNSTADQEFMISYASGVHWATHARVYGALLLASVVYLI